jgi:hypothetical protein
MIGIRRKVLYLWYSDDKVQKALITNKNYRMKSRKFFLLFVMTFNAYQAIAGTGYARDGLLSSLVILGILMVFAGLLYFIDFLKKDGRKLLANFLNMIWEINRHIATLLQRIRSRQDLIENNYNTHCDFPNHSILQE